MERSVSRLLLKDMRHRKLSDARFFCFVLEQLFALQFNSSSCWPFEKWARWTVGEKRILQARALTKNNYMRGREWDEGWPPLRLVSRLEGQSKQQCNLQLLPHGERMIHRTIVAFTTSGGVFFQVSFLDGTKMGCCKQLLEPVKWRPPHPPKGELLSVLVLFHAWHATS